MIKKADESRRCQRIQKLTNLTASNAKNATPILIKVFNDPL